MAELKKLRVQPSNDGDDVAVSIVLHVDDDGVARTVRVSPAPRPGDVKLFFEHLSQMLNGLGGYVVALDNKGVKEGESG